MGDVRVVHNDAVDQKTKHELATLAAELEDVYWELNDATELDLPDSLYSDIELTKGTVDELTRHIKHFLQAARQSTADDDAAAGEGE